MDGKKDKPFEGLGTFFRSARKERGFSQIQLAKESEVSQPTISRLENGSLNVRLDKIKDVLNALDAQVQFEFYLSPKKA